METDISDLTVRDKVWNATLELLDERPVWVTLGRVRDRAELKHSHDRTIRRTLRAMEATGWLERESDQAQKWQHGPKFNERFRK